MLQKVFMWNLTNGALHLLVDFQKVQEVRCHQVIQRVRYRDCLAQRQVDGFDQEMGET